MGNAISYDTSEDLGEPIETELYRDLGSLFALGVPLTSFVNIYSVASSNTQNT